MTDLVIAIQERVLGRRDDLKISELQNLMKLDPSPELLTAVVTMLSSSKGKVGTSTVDPTNFLIAVVPAVRTVEHLIYLGLAFRAGANPDVYVTTEKYGQLHLLGYVYSRLYDQIQIDLLNGVMVLILKAGAELAKPAFALSKELGSNEVPETIARWLERAGYEVPDLNNIPGPYLNELALILNRPELAVSSIEAPRVVQFHATRFKFEPTPDSLFLSILNLNSKAYKHHLESGIVAKYIATNKMLTLLDEYTRKGYTLAVVTIRLMLIEGIKHGQQLDKEQFNLLSTANPDVARDVEAAYTQPYWEKVCTVDKGTVTKKLLRQSASLGLVSGPATKAYLCDQLRNFSRADHNLAVQAAIKRQKERLALEHSVLTDFVVAAPKTEFDGVCRMSKTKLNSPYEYVDFAVASYRDASGTVWCYTADSFDNLVDSKLNPTTLQPLPETFILKLQNQIQTMTKLGLKPTDVKSITQALADLRKPDEISNDQTDRYISAIEKVFLINGINLESVKNLGKEKYDKIISDLSGIDTEIRKLTQSHAYATWCRLCRALVESSPEGIELLTERLRLETI